MSSAPTARVLGRLLTVAAAVAVAMFAGWRSPAPAADAPLTGPVVVELFTSQGCSSCPPADRFLSELAAQESPQVIALSFHVDYWNYIGWTDPFSSEAWSQRQRRYARLFGANRIYTPQMVVDGRWEGVGSDRAEISGFLERAGSSPRLAAIGVSAELATEDRLSVSVTAERVNDRLPGGKLSAWLAIVESDLVTAVGRGENVAKSLRNDRVVRSLVPLAGLDPVRAGAAVSVDLDLDPGWRRDKLSVVAFLQNSESLRILAAAEAAL